MRSNPVNINTSIRPPEKTGPVIFAKKFLDLDPRSLSTNKVFGIIRKKMLLFLKLLYFQPFTCT